MSDETTAPEWAMTSYTNSAVYSVPSRSHRSSPTIDADSPPTQVGGLVGLSITHDAEQLELLGEAVHEEPEDLRGKSICHVGIRFDAMLIADGRTNAGELAKVVRRDDRTRIQHERNPSWTRLNSKPAGF